MPQNSFAVDYGPGETVIDINNPPTTRYQHQEFPRLVYQHESGQVMQVADAKQLAAALKKNFDLKPASNRDYSKVTNVVLNPATNEFAAGIAAVHGSANAKEAIPTAADLVTE